MHCTHSLFQKIFEDGTLTNSLGEEISFKNTMIFMTTSYGCNANRIGFNDDMIEPIPEMIEQLKFSTDWICPVSAACYYDGRWYFGTNQSNFNIPKYEFIDDIK